ncbi:hypothetical protein Naga_102064g1 [Nannochloropsis gaditana]|uniref:Uncharacterized protein n=1 Tax=Nannochloropsis gaditana TaxID=72520 RepID=W7T2M3_9STRA|nr:hypothetical protein Naga_102064g1 [Nannochloropsis gaditana]
MWLARPPSLLLLLLSLLSSAMRASRAAVALATSAAMARAHLNASVPSPAIPSSSPAPEEGKEGEKEGRKEGGKEGKLRGRAAVVAKAGEGVRFLLLQETIICKCLLRVAVTLSGGDTAEEEGEEEGGKEGGREGRRRSVEGRGAICLFLSHLLSYHPPVLPLLLRRGELSSPALLLLADCIPAFLLFLPPSLPPSIPPFSLRGTSLVTHARDLAVLAEFIRRYPLPAAFRSAHSAIIALLHRHLRPVVLQGKT